MDKIQNKVILMVVLFLPLLSLNLYSRARHTEMGTWPKEWPMDLEPFRENSKTVEFRTSIHENIYQITFDNRDSFESIWPSLLSLKSDNTSLRLISMGDMTDKNDSSVLLKNESPAVRIISPPFNTKLLRELGIKTGKKSEWVPYFETESIPEYAISTDNGKFRAYDIKSSDMESFKIKIRVQTRLELVVDGEIIDLNRIHLPGDTFIIDNRKL